MKLFLLGAGKPAYGDKPTALKQISSSTTVLDWKIHSYEDIIEPQNIYFLGGYHLNEIIEKYPDLNFSLTPNWEKKNILDTLFSAPFSEAKSIISYADTIFRKDVIEEMLEIEADVVFAYDSLWKERFEARSLEDISIAETLIVDAKEVEFTGLLSLSPALAQKIKTLNVVEVGSNLLDLINYLQKENFSVKSFDILGKWAEFNSPNDIAKFILGTKADTLARLEPLVKKSHIGKQVSFTSLKWQDNPSEVLQEIQENFIDKNLVVRSSSKGEDNWDSSNAGGFESILNVDISNPDAIASAIDSVIDSYTGATLEQDQVLVQAFLSEVKVSGVIFTCGLESGAPYYRINFDDVTQSTESVTAGTHGDLRTVIVSRLNTKNLDKIEPLLVPVLEAIQELEQLLEFDKLDIEFAIDKNSVVHIFQVRPISVNHSDYDLDIKDIKSSIKNAKKSFINKQHNSPFLFGERTVLANMPDWNPAEIIGTRPKPFAFSLYREIITNDIWAQQRSEFGYIDVRPCALISSLCGQPYVDARASFNSFIPNNLTSSLKLKLANAYIDILAQNPQLHDKVEFDVVYTVWTSDFLKSAQERFKPYDISTQEILELEKALKEITKKAFLRLKSDIVSSEELQTRREALNSSTLSSLEKALALLDDCKKFGTLAFSHAARAGFIATTFLNSFVLNSFLKEDRKHEFLMSFKTVAGEFENDKYLFSIGSISLEELTQKYGHLRAGTYEVGVEAYWENPRQYLIPDKPQKPKNIAPFELTQEEILNFELVLKELGSDISAKELLEYFKEAIQAREFIKFEFTKNLSKALDFVNRAGNELKIKRKNLSFLEYSDLEQLKLNVLCVKNIKKNIKKRKKRYITTQAVELPSLIQNISDFDSFERHSSEPNFVTTKKVEAPVHLFESAKEVDMSGKVVMIPQADPGYDWLFSHNIAGLITQYGGANSHMAIRAAEIGLPSAIGVGEKLYEKISLMRRVEIDCSGRTIREIT